MNEHSERTESGDEALDDLVRDLARDYNEPPAEMSAEKREQLWTRIQKTRGIESARPRVRSSVQRSPAPSPMGARITQILWPVAAAAILLIGITIGRQISEPNGSVVDAESGGVTPSIGLVENDDAGDATEGSDRWSQPTSEAMYRLAAGRYLARTDALLTEFRQAAVSPTPGMPGAGAGVNPPMLGWAGDLLLETRLLQDSPLGKNAELSRLLNDLELILAQIVQMADEANPRERELIRESIEQRSLLFRVREEIPAKDDRSRA
jgi:hypothetical protein